MRVEIKHVDGDLGGLPNYRWRRGHLHTTAQHVPDDPASPRGIPSGYRDNSTGKPTATPGSQLPQRVIRLVNLDRKFSRPGLNVSTGGDHTSSTLEKYMFGKVGGVMIDAPVDVARPDPRPDDQVSSWKQKDPIERTQHALFDRGAADEMRDTQMRDEVAKVIEEAEKFASGSPMPDPEDAFEDVYA